MRRAVVLLLLALVFVLGNCEGDSKAKQDLEAKLKQVAQEIGNLKKENENLEKLIKEERKQSNIKVKVSERLVNASNVDNFAQHQVLEQLYGELSNTRFEITEYRNIQENVEKLKLGIEIIEENIIILKNRRRNGLTQKCLELEKMASNRTRSETTPGTKPRSMVEDTVVLEDLLRLRNTELNQLKYRNSELKAELKDIRDLLEKINKDLNEQIEQGVHNHFKGKAAIESVEKELKKEKETLKGLEEQKVEKVEQFKKWVLKAKSALTKYQRLAADVQCFGKLYNDVFGLVVQKP